MYNQKKTKIVATVGPATSEKSVLENIIREGVNVIRINFSHGSHEDHEKIIAKVREINKEKQIHTAILADLQGPKIRIGEIKGGTVEVSEGSEILFSNEEMVGDEKAVYMSYESFAHDVKVGERILIDDGKLALEIIHTDKKGKVKARFLNGGKLSSNKGVNLPNTKISLPCLTEKDLKDLKFALKLGVEWVGLSFVRNARDLIELKHLIRAEGKSARVIAKIEKPEAINDIDEIIEETDAIMVARGDLGVEVP